MEAGQGLRVVPLKNSIPPFGLYWPVSTGPRGRCGRHVANVTFKGSPQETGNRTPRAIRMSARGSQRPFPPVQLKYTLA